MNAPPESSAHGLRGAAVVINAALFPVRLTMYVRRARRGEQRPLRRFGDVDRRYRAPVPAFVPRRRRNADPLAPTARP